MMWCTVWYVEEGKKNKITVKKRGKKKKKRKEVKLGDEECPVILLVLLWRRKIRMRDL